jgi:hypothetical protein
MSFRRRPTSCCWQSLLAVPLALFLLVLILLYFFSPSSVLAQEPAARNGGEEGTVEEYEHERMAPTITAGVAVNSIEIDGVLDEAVWLTAEVFSGFRQREPDDGAPVSERTEVRVLAGPGALYVGAWLFDSQPDEIRATLVRRDVVSDFDFFMVNLDSRHDHNTSYAFTLTPSGAYQDAVLGTDGQYDFGWDPVWEGAASKDEEGWYGEWRIPYSQLRFQGSQDPVWGIQFTRSIARKQETATFAYTPRSEASGPHRYGHLLGIGQLHSPRRLELLPYATTRSEHLNVHPADPFRGISEQFFAAGLDLKYGITSNLTLDATINPDFGQVEVDPAVVNLTQYETYFPERRPFFVEGAEIFRYGLAGSGMNQSDFGELFYSRRVGRAPQRDLYSEGAWFVGGPEQTTIVGAMKMSGRVGKWSVGLMEALTGEEHGHYRGSEGLNHSAVVEPLSNYLVARSRRDFRDGNSTIGGIVTAVNRDLSDPALESVLHSSAHVAGIDFVHRWRNREWFLNGTLTGSTVRGDEAAIHRTQRSPARYWQRPDAGHVDLDPNRTRLDGWRGSLSTGKSAGEHWLGSILLQAQSPGFEANDLGFETRVDSWDINVAMQYRDMEPDRRTRFYQIDFLPTLEWNFDGDLVGANVFLGSIQQWPNYWMSSTAISAHPETDNDRLTRGGPVARNPGGASVSQWISTDQRKSYNFSGNFTYSWNARGGWGIMPSLGFTFRPSSAVEVSLEPSYRNTGAVAQYVSAVEDPTADRTFGARYVFSDLEQTVLSMDTRVSWTFTPRLSLQLYLQPFVAKGDYSAFKELHAPRVWDWDVYGEERGTISELGGGYVVDPDGDGPAESFNLRNPDFNVRSMRGNAVLRWEYRPGSTVYLVWQQQRLGAAGYSENDLMDDALDVWNIPPENVFALKVSYWWGR